MGAPCREREHLVHDALRQAHRTLTATYHLLVLLTSSASLSSAEPTSCESPSEMTMSHRMSAIAKARLPPTSARSHSGKPRNIVAAP